MKTKRIYIRVSEADEQAIRENATQANLSVSEYIRRSALNTDILDYANAAVAAEPLVISSDTVGIETLERMIKSEKQIEPIELYQILRKNKVI